MDIAALIKADKAKGARRLVEEYGNRLYETAFRLCGNETDAQDYTFRTLERAVERIESFVGKSSLFTWLYSILANIIRSDARRKGNNSLVFPGDVPEEGEGGLDAGEILAEREEAVAVRSAISVLPPELREVLVFRYYEDMTVPEIAHVLSLPEGTVKSHIHAAKKTVRAKIARTVRSDDASNGKEKKL